MRKLPTIPRPGELIDSAFGRAKKAPSKATGPLGRQRSVSMSKIQSVADYLSERLEVLVEAYSAIEPTPFVREMLSIRLGPKCRTEDQLLYVQLERLTGAVKIIRRLRNEHLARIVKSDPSKSMGFRKAFYGRVMSIIDGLEKDLSVMNAARKMMLTTPDIRKDRPVIVIAGFPNAGKSSLLRRVSSGRPMIAPYPFTTQELHVGHADLGRLEVQFVDTPGLLDREEGARNEIEARAIAALRHLPDLVLFLIDPTGTCGTVDEQMHLLGSLKELFKGIEIIPLFTKCDAVDSIPAHPEVAIRVSSVTGEGIDGLLELIVEKLKEKRPATGTIDVDSLE